MRLHLYLPLNVIIYFSHFLSSISWFFYFIWVQVVMVPITLMFQQVVQVALLPFSLSSYHLHQLQLVELVKVVKLLMVVILVVTLVVVFQFSFLVLLFELVVIMVEVIIKQLVVVKLVIRQLVEVVVKVQVMEGLNEIGCRLSQLLIMVMFGIVFILVCMFKHQLYQVQVLLMAFIYASFNLQAFTYHTYLIYSFKLIFNYVSNYKYKYNTNSFFTKSIG